MDYAHPKRRLLPVCLFCLLTSGWGSQAVLGQETEENDTPASEPPVQERRVRRLGDVVADSYNLDLVVPQAPVESAPEAFEYDVGNNAQNQQLQDILTTLTIRPSDPAAKAELNDLLDLVIARAIVLMESGKKAEATQLLSVVRSIDPSKSGLEEAAARGSRVASDTTQPTRPPPSTQKKTGSVGALSSYSLPDAAQTERLEALLSTLSRRPGSQSTMRELDVLLEDILQQAERAIDRGDYESAEQMQAVVRAVNPRKRGLVESRSALTQSQEIDALLRNARAAEQAGVLIEPLLESAYYYYRKVLDVDEKNREASEGLAAIQQVMVVYALDAAKNLDFELSEAWLKEAENIRTSPEVIDNARDEINGFRDLTAANIEAEISTAIAEGDYNLAEFKLIDLIALGGYEDRVTAMRQLMTREEAYGQYEAGEVIQDRFRDGSSYAPTLVVISAGSFLMGSPADERDRADSEAPLHRVNFERGFALGQHEITVGQFRQFVRSTSYRTEAQRSRASSVWDEELGQLTEKPNVNWELDYAGGPAMDDHPVLHVTWNDAVAYADWLSSMTGERYRLPSEAEFEYVMRSGSRTRYWWGDKNPSDRLDNLAGQKDKSPGGRSFSSYFRNYGDDHFGPALVGQFMANGFGVYDMGGNVSEWVNDCWHSNYVRAPADGSSWENAGCARRVVRGGYWASSPRQARAAARMSAPVSLHAPQLGFRVARDLF